MPVQMFVIALAGFKTKRLGPRRLRETATFYVTGVYWGRGSEISKFLWSENRDKAAQFSQYTVHDAVRELCGPKFRRKAYAVPMD